MPAIWSNLCLFGEAFMVSLTHCGLVNSVKFGSDNVLVPDGTKPSPEPMSANHSEVLWHSPEGNFTGNADDIYPWYGFKIYYFKITATSPRGQWVNGFCCTKYVSIHPMNNAHCALLCFAVVRWWLIWPISSKVTSLELSQIIQWPPVPVK